MAHVLEGYPIQNVGAATIISAFTHIRNVFDALLRLTGREVIGGWKVIYIFFWASTSRVQSKTEDKRQVTSDKRLETSDKRQETCWTRDKSLKRQGTLDWR